MRSSECPVRLTHLWRRIGDRLIILSDATFNIRRLELNEVGGRAWELADGARSLRSIIELIAMEYPDESIERIAGSLLPFFAELEAEHFLTTRQQLDEYD